MTNFLKQSMNKTTLSRLSQILEKLMSMKVCAPFIEMVDPVRDNAPDYLTYVKEPMSLNEVKKRLKSGQYSTVEEFRRDVDLIWENAKTYNGDDTLLFYMAMEAKRRFAKKMDQFEKPLEIVWVEKFLKLTRILNRMLEHPPKEYFIPHEDPVAKDNSTKTTKTKETTVEEAETKAE